MYTLCQCDELLFWLSLMKIVRSLIYYKQNVDEEELKELMDAAMGMSGELEFKDDGYIELVLRILGLMCDNQHNEIQVQTWKLCC